MVSTGKKFMAGLAGLLLCCLTMMNCYAMESYPEEIEVDVLADLYEGVVFDHGLHVMMTEGCAVCHHHTTGTPVVDSYCAKCHADEEPMASVSCQDCHSSEPVTAGNVRGKDALLFHDDKPDLKAAYHLSCLGCHQEMGAPVGCQDCHARTETGDAFFHSGQFAPAESAGSSGH